MRLRYGNGNRERFSIPIRDAKAAKLRAGRLVALAKALTQANVPPLRIKVYLEEACIADGALLSTLEKRADALRKKAGKASSKPRAELPTFQELALEWTSGELHERFPDQVANIFPLALGVNEDWVRSRTGHKSSELLRHRQSALGLAELALGDVDSLVSALPDLASRVGQRVGQKASKAPEELLASIGNHTPSEGGGTGRRARFRF